MTCAGKYDPLNGWNVFEKWSYCFGLCGVKLAIDDNCMGTDLWKDWSADNPARDTNVHPRRWTLPTRRKMNVSSVKSR